MSSRPSLFDLYDSLLNLERRIAEGEIPTAAELATVLEANSGEPLPAWFSALVAMGLRGELKKKRGRPPKDDALASIRFQLAMAEYDQCLTWLREPERSVEPEGWTAVCDQSWGGRPPHERAARLVTSRWFRHMDWDRF